MEKNLDTSKVLFLTEITKILTNIELEEKRKLSDNEKIEIRNTFNNNLEFLAKKFLEENNIKF